MSSQSTQEPTPTAPLRRVLVMGSGGTLSAERERVARAVGAALARQGYRLVTGAWTGVDTAVAEAFAAQQEPHLVPQQLIRLTSERSDRDGPGEYIDYPPNERSGTWALTQADVLVLIGGGKWSKALFDEAWKLGKPVLPLGGTKGAALEAWTTLRKKPRPPLPGISEAELEQLGPNSADPEALAAHLVGVLDHLFAVRENRAKRLILVKGSSRTQNEVTAQVAQAVGRGLAKAGYGLLTFRLQGIEEVVRQSFEEVLRQQGIPPATRVAVATRETGGNQDEAVVAKALEDIPQDLMKDGRIYQDSVVMADAVVLIGGSNLTQHVFDLAQKQKKPVFPIPSTEGAAATAYERIHALWSDQPLANIEREAFDELGMRVGSSVDAETVAGVLTGLLDRLFPVEPFQSTVTSSAAPSSIGTGPEPRAEDRGLESLPPEAATPASATESPDQLMVEGQRLFRAPAENGQPGPARAAPLFRAAVQGYERQEQHDEVAEALWWLGETALAAGDWREARSCYERSLELSRLRMTDRSDRPARCLHQLGILDRLEGKLPESESHLTEALRAAESIGARHWEGSAFYELGRTAAAAGQWPEAEKRFLESRKRWAAENDREGVAGSLAQLARMALYAGDLVKAQRLAQESLNAWQKLQHASDPFVRQVRELVFQLLSGQGVDTTPHLEEAARELEQLGGRVAAAGRPLLSALRPQAGRTQDTSKISELAQESVHAFAEADELAGLALAVLVWSHTDQLAAAIAAVSPAEEQPAPSPPETVAASGTPVPNWHPTGKRVLVVGSGAYTLPQEVEWAAREVGRMLAAEGHSLVTGGFAGVDHVAAEEYAGYLDQHGASPDEHITQVRPRNQPPDFPRGKPLYGDPGGANYRLSVSQADAIVMIGGRGGAAFLFEAAQEAGLPAFPLPTTRGDAGKAFTQLSQSWEEGRYPGITPDEFRRLDQPIDSREDAARLADTVAELLRSVFAASSGSTIQPGIRPGNEAVGSGSVIGTSPDNPAGTQETETAPGTTEAEGAEDNGNAASIRENTPVSPDATQPKPLPARRPRLVPDVYPARPRVRTVRTGNETRVRSVVEVREVAAPRRPPEEGVLRVEVYQHVVKVKFGGLTYQSPNLLKDANLLALQNVDPQGYGEALFNAIFNDRKVPEGNLTTLAGFQTAMAQNPLRLELELESTPADAGLPLLRAHRWEYLRQPGAGEPLAVNPNVPLFRLQPERPADPAPARPLRVLVALCAPLDLGDPNHPWAAHLAPIETAAERQTIANAFRKLEETGLATCKVLDGAATPLTREALHEELENGAYHALHLVAHGVFWQPLGQYCLVMEGGQRQAVLEPLARFDRSFFPASLKLVVLASCQGACRLDGVQVGMGPQLTQWEIPAVIAMQDDMPVTAFQYFTQCFYDDLARTGRVDTAVAATRYNMYHWSPSDPYPLINKSWGLPVLVMTTGDGQLFQVDTDLARTLGEFQPEITPPSRLPGGDPDQRRIRQMLAAETGAAADDPAIQKALGMLLGAAPAREEETAPRQDRARLQEVLTQPLRIAATELQAFIEKAPDGPRLELEPALYRQVAGALNAGKHLIFIGPPGTAKTTLAQAVAAYAERQRYAAGAALATATADWTTFDTVGGYAPTRGGTLQFRPGLFLRALSEGRWLVIDEINRAEIDKAFGELFTLLSGQQVDLPYLVGGRPVRILPPGQGPVWAPPEEREYHDYAMHPSWRILATMNAYDKSYLFAMSFAFMRRFAFIDVGLPSDGVYGTLIQRWIGEHSELDNTGLAGMLSGLLKRNTPLMERRALGPAIVKDIITYVGSCYSADHAAIQLLAEAYLLYGVAQLDGLDAEGIGPIYSQLLGFLTEHQCGWKDRKQVLDRVRLLYPHLPLETWASDPEPEEQPGGAPNG